MEQLNFSPEDRIERQMFWNLGNVARKILFAVLSAGPIPRHIAFILDGNRRFAKKWNLTEGGGHNAGFLAVIRMLKYCYELGVKYVSIYAFSIDNFRRKPHEVELLMNLMKIKMEELAEVEGLVHQFGVRVYFAGNLKLLCEPIQKACARVMAETAKNTKAVLVVCLAYTSTDEITHSVQECCDEILQDRGEGGGNISSHHHHTVHGTTNGHVERDPTRGTHSGGGGGGLVNLERIERNMYMAVAPEPDILVRTSGETRLSNFFLWQAGCCMLYSPATLWPEIGMRDLVWAVLNFQRGHSYLQDKKKKQRL